MKLLVTGASGFIGRNLAEHLGARHETLAPSRAELDLLDAGAVRAYLVRHHFDAVIHAATGRSHRNLSGGPDLCARNCRLFFNLARSSDYYGRLFSLSSGMVYDRPHCHPRMREEEFDLHVPTDEYGFSKYVCAKAMAAMERAFELRLFGVFGPHEAWDVRFISNACCRAVWDMPLVMRQNVFFDYMDVEDLGWILDNFLKKDLQHRQYNLATGRTYDLKTLAEKVVKASGKNLEIRIGQEGLGAEYSADHTRMLDEIPDFHFRDMDDSITRLYRWYESHKQEIDPARLRLDG